MTAISHLVTIYAQLNLLLATSYLIFIGLRRLISALRFRMPYQQLVRWGQGLVLFSLLLPIAFQLFPERKMPTLNFGAFRPAVEVSSKGEKDTSLKPAPSISSAVKTATNDQSLGKLLTSLKRFQTWAVALIWLAGLGICLFRLLKSYLALKALVLDATLIRKLGRVRVAVSEPSLVPFSTRLIGASWIVLPSTILEKRSDFTLAIKHELQHHRQHDTFWAIAAEILVCAFYFNPVIYFWKKEIMELQEFACDEALIGHKNVSSRDYGSCLVRVAETALETRQMYVGTTCMAAAFKSPMFFKSFLRRRVEMLMIYRRSRARPWAGICIGTIAMLGTLAVAYSAESTVRRVNAESVNPGSIQVNESIQRITETALFEAVKNQKAASGFAIVADPNTGRILAVANIDTKAKKSGQWALAQRLEPASLLKTLVAATAIHKGLTTPDEKHACENGNYRYGDRVYHDWKKTGWDHLSTKETIANSSNICAIKIGEKLGSAGLREMLLDFGFGPRGSTQALPGARPGQLPPDENPDRPRIVPYVSSGFGFQVTPIELLQAYGAIANGGKLMKPIAANAPVSEIKVMRHVLTPAASQQTKEILRHVVLEGTAKGRAESNLYTTAGKTATGHSVGLTERESTKGNQLADVAAFVGFAPVSSPSVEVLVGIQDPHTDTTGAHGSVHAAPVFKKIIEGALKELKIAPDKPQA